MAGVYEVVKEKGSKACVNGNIRCSLGHSGSGEERVVGDGIAETPGPLSRILYWSLFILSNKLSTGLIRMPILKLISLDHC